VAIEVNGSFKFHSERLHNPERVYYDIVNAHVKIDSKPYYLETVGDSVLQRVRVAENTPGTTRVVLELTGPVTANVSKLTNPDRLIVELHLKSGKEPRTDVPPTNPPATIPAPGDPSDRPAVDPPSSPAPPPPTAAAKPSRSVKPVKNDLPVEDPGSVTPSAADPAKPGESNGSDPASPAPTAGSGENRVPDPGPDEVGKAAKRNSSGDSSLIRALGLKINRVVIDPGHGGHDQGTSGKTLNEKDLVLDIALRVGKLVKDRMGAEVVYTRSDDTFVPLEGRTAMANEKKADLFLSIHANSSSTYPKITGVESYYLNISGTKEAMDVAMRENGPTHNSIYDLQDLVKKIAQHDKSEESHEFARRVQASLFAFNQKYFPGAKDRGVKTAPFIVLIGANMPSVLAEIGFLSNSHEESLLKTSEYRNKLAEALYNGMKAYAESLSHFQATSKP
jgi:N-acetylmuramoyl-L-alanine amidase